MFPAFRLFDPVAASLYWGKEYTSKLNRKMSSWDILQQYYQGRKINSDYQFYLYVIALFGLNMAEIIEDGREIYFQPGPISYSLTVTDCMR